MFTKQLTHAKTGRFPAIFSHIHAMRELHWTNNLVYVRKVTSATFTLKI